MNEAAVRIHAVEHFRPDPNQLYDVAMTARLAGVPRRTVLVYCRWGLVRPSANPEVDGWYFSSETIVAIRRIEYFRIKQGVNLPGIRIITQLLDHLERTLPSRSWSCRGEVPRHLE